MVFWGRAESAQFIRRHAEYTSKRNDDPRRRKLHFCFLIGNHALRGAHLNENYREQVRTNINVLH
jgi:hypothetical protein